MKATESDRGKRHRAATWFALAVFFVLATGILPACAEGCCAVAAETSMHAQMACCDTQPSFAPSETVRLQPATAATVPAVVVVAWLGTPADARVPNTDPEAVSPTHHEPSPPLFLRNAQLLI